jgi:hypothetical protein
MGSKSSSTQQTTAETSPWSKSMPMLEGILSQLQAGLGNTGVTSAEDKALGQLSAGAQNPFAGILTQNASELLSGGGATAQSPMVNSAYSDYQRRLSPIADGANIGPNGNPALRGYLDTIASDVQNRVNGMFAGAGRDLSGANQGAVARGIAEGTAPILASQYNTDVSNMLGAAGSLYGAGNTTAGLLTGMQQQGLANKQAGAEASMQAQDANLSGARGVLEAEALRRGIPMESLGLLAQIGIPIAGLGGTQTGTQTGTNRMSGAQQFSTITGGLANLGKFMWG